MRDVTSQRGHVAGVKGQATANYRIRLGGLAACATWRINMRFCVVDKIGAGWKDEMCNSFSEVQVRNCKIKAFFGSWLKPLS